MVCCRNTHLYSHILKGKNMTDKESYTALKSVLHSGKNCRAYYKEDIVSDLERIVAKIHNRLIEEGELDNEKKIDKEKNPPEKTKKARPSK